ncbi:MAG: hypothetical protein KF843_07220 [Flavobacteriales bacterium]|nr:hypothetical protein [Flavobacteriales bacterium]
MHSSTGSTPVFRAYSLVCTALSMQPLQGMVHRLVTHTTHPLEKEVRYVFLSDPAPKISGEKR